MTTEQFPELQQEDALRRHGFQREVWREKDGGCRLVLYRKEGFSVVFGAYIDEGDTLLYVMTLPKDFTKDYERVS